MDRSYRHLKASRVTVPAATKRLGNLRYVDARILRPERVLDHSIAPPKPTRSEWRVRKLRQQFLRGVAGIVIRDIDHRHLMTTDVIEIGLGDELGDIDVVAAQNRFTVLD